MSDGEPRRPEAESVALRTIYREAGRLQLDPDLFPPLANGLVEALGRVTNRDRVDEHPNRRATYLKALGYLAGQDKRLPQPDVLLEAYQGYLATLAPSAGLVDPFRDLIDPATGHFDPPESLGHLVPPDQDEADELERMLRLYDDDVCNIGLVTVNGTPAVWIYSELTTRTPIDELDEWVDPRQWDTWGPLLFKGMEVAQPPGESGLPPNQPPPPRHYTAIFNEQVDLFGVPLRNDLACAVRLGDRVSAMTYDLWKSVEGGVAVDRGFVSATAIDGGSRLQVLKIIGFTDDRLQEAMRAACPLWADFIRFAADHADDIVHGREPAPTTPLELACEMAKDRWVEGVKDAADFYADFVVEACHPTSWCSPSALSTTSSRLVQRLAEDWATIWTQTNELAQGFTRRSSASAAATAASAAPPAAAGGAGGGGAGAGAGAGPDPSLLGMGANPGPGGGASLELTIDVPPGPSPVVLWCSDLEAIDATKFVIPGSSVVVSPSSVAPGQAGVTVRLALRQPCPHVGLHDGTLHVGNPSVAEVPVALYVSGAVPTS